MASSTDTTATSKAINGRWRWSKPIGPATRLGAPGSHLILGANLGTEESNAHRLLTNHRCRQHHYMHIVRQRNTLHVFRRVQVEAIRVKVEGTLVLRPVLVVAIRHRDAFQLARILLRRKPAAEALHEVRDASVGIIDR